MARRMAPGSAALLGDVGRERVGLVRAVPGATRESVAEWRARRLATLAPERTRLSASRQSPAPGPLEQRASGPRRLCLAATRSASRVPRPTRSTAAQAAAGEWAREAPRPAAEGAPPRSPRPPRLSARALRATGRPRGPKAAEKAATERSGPPWGHQRQHAPQRGRTAVQRAPEAASPPPRRGAARCPPRPGSKRGGSGLGCGTARTRQRALDPETPTESPT